MTTDYPDQQYIDTGWIGSPESMTAALSALGWEATPSESPPTLHSDVRGFTSVVETVVDDQVMWVCLIRSTQPLPLPIGITVASNNLISETTGYFS